MRLFLQKSRHQSVYYFRRKVPLDLRGHLARDQLYQTLHTCERSTAVIRARRLAALTDNIFDALRKMTEEEFKNSPLGRLIAERRQVGPLKQRIEELQEQLLDTRIAASQQIAELKADNIKTLQAVISSVGRETASTDTPVSIVTMTIREAANAMLSSGSIKPRTAKRYRSIFDDMGAFLSWETQMHEVTPARFVQYTDRVNSGKRADATKRNYITIASRLFNWAHARDSRIPTMSTAGLKIKRAKPAFMDRGAFTLQEIGNLFQNVSVNRYKHPHYFWATVAPAFLGCRIEELAQANLATDFKQDAASGVWYLSVNEDDTRPDKGGKSVKRLSSWRNIPIHSALIRHGFLEYLHTEGAAGAESPFSRHWRPWHDPKTGAFIREHSIVKWGGRQLKRLRKAGLVTTAKTTYFHSMRHTLITHLALASVAPEWRAALCGQDAEGGVNEAIYSKLRDKIGHLSSIVESHLAEYVEALDAATLAHSTA